MSTDRDTTRIVRSWLRTEESESADRVLGAVLDRLDTTPQRRSAIPWAARRYLLMTTSLRWGAAAVVAAAVLIGAVFIYGNGPVGLGSPSPPPSASAIESPSESPSPTPAASGSLPESGSVAPGSYAVADPFPLQIGFDIGPGWAMWSPGVLQGVVAVYKGSPDPPAGMALGFMSVENLNADPCEPGAGLMDPPVGPAPMDLALALAAQTGTESSDPIPVTVSGYSGVFIDYRNTGDGECPNLHRWPGREALNGERDQVWILDVDGTRLVIDAASFEGTSEVDVAEMRAIVESMTIAP